MADINEIYAELDAFIGMTEAKKTVRQIVDTIGLTKDKNHNNIVITGSIGTGKTMLARIIPKLLCADGSISKDKPVECIGYDLKGAYIGQSKDIVNKYCDEAMGGVLFIDEAYCLVNENGPVDEFARDALDALLARMENDKGKFIVIAAGYPEEMNFFLDKANPGMRRRFEHLIALPDFTADELYKIFEQSVQKDGCNLTEAAKEKARETINKISANRGPVFGNAREMRMLYEKISNNAVKRAVQLPKEQQKDAVKIIEAEDFIV